MVIAVDSSNGWSGDRTKGKNASCHRYVSHIGTANKNTGWGMRLSQTGHTAFTMLVNNGVFKQD